MEKLTPRQRLFADEYLIDLNATQAAIRAGYSAKTAAQSASRLLRSVKIAAVIAERQQARSARTELTQDWVLERLRENTSRAMQAVPVMEFDREEKKMVETGEYQYEGAVVNRAVELIGKHLGMFADRLEHRFPDLPREEAAGRIAAIMLNAKARKPAMTNGKH